MFLLCWATWNFSLSTCTTWIFSVPTYITCVFCANLTNLGIWCANLCNLWVFEVAICQLSIWKAGAYQPCFDTSCYMMHRFPWPQILIWECATVCLSDRSKTSYSSLLIISEFRFTKIQRIMLMRPPHTLSKCNWIHFVVLMQSIQHKFMWPPHTRAKFTTHSWRDGIYVFGIKHRYQSSNIAPY